MKITKITLDMIKNSSWYKPEQLSWFETNLPDGIELTRKAVKVLEDIIPVDLAEAIETDFALRNIREEISIERDSEEDYALRMIGNIFTRDFQGEDSLNYVPEDITPEEAEEKKYAEIISRTGNITEETEDDCKDFPLYYTDGIYRVLADAFYDLDSANKNMSYNHVNMYIYGYMRRNLTTDLRPDNTGYMIARVSGVRFRIPMSMFVWIMHDVCKGVFSSRLKINDKKASDFLSVLSEGEKTTVAKLREKTGKTQREVADESGISIRQYQRIESGESRLSDMAYSNVVSLAKALKTEPDELIKNQGKESHEI